LKSGAPNSVNEDSKQQSRGFFRSAGTVSAAVALSRLTGVAREMVMARLFGAGAAYDAFLLGMRIPNLTRNLFAEGALSSAFVPTFTEYLSGRKKEESRELSNVVATALSIAASAVCVAGIAASPFLVRLMAPGYAKIPGKFELAVLLTRVMFPFLLLVSLAAQAMGVLNACDRYGVPALASAFFNIGSVVAGLVLGFTVGRSSDQGLIVCMAVGVLAGGLFQLLWQMPSLYREGFAFRPRLNLRHPGLRRIGRLMAPAVLGNAAVQINLIVNTNLASSLTDPAGRTLNGPVSWLGYAFRFLQLPLGLFGVAIASATLPTLARSAACAWMEEYRAAIARSLGAIFLFTVPSSVGLAVLGESMIGAIYEWGKFSAWDTHQTAVALAWYSGGLAGYSMIKVLAPAFYALDDARTPAMVSLGSIALNLALGLFFVKYAGMGHAGLALSTAFVALAGGVTLFWLLRSRIHGLHGRGLAIRLGKIACASLVMGAVCWMIRQAVHEALGSGKIAQFAELAAGIPAGAAVFYATASALGIPELEAIRTACYTSIRNAFRPETGDPLARD
jgi:putative peptidoglycan lipid II flippase